jgi:hypothetical protein
MKYILALIICLSFLINLQASVRRTCNVSYYTEDGWSKEYTMEVEFATGGELNRRMNTYNYSEFQVYSLVWFSQEEVAIIEIDLKTIVASNFQRDAFRNLFYFDQFVNGLQVNSKSKVKWKITAKNIYNNFIDNRENN